MISDDLVETLRQAQRFGFFGARPIEDAIDHAHSFVRAVGEAPAGTRLLDLGSGGGLPGLVLAAEFPEADVVLLDRRQKRTDFLERAVQRLGFDHVRVWCRDAEDVVREIGVGSIPAFDVVTARGFGPPETTVRTAVGCLGTIGRIVISEPPSGDRWSPRLLDELGLEVQRRGAVVVFERGIPGWSSPTAPD